MKIMLALLISFCSALTFASGKDVSYKSAGQEYQGYFISPSATAPLILLIHDWDGLTDYEVKRAQMLSAQGYAVFAVDLFGKGVRPTKMEDKRQHTGELYKNREKLQQILKDSLAAAEKQGASIQNTVVLGYCFGGAATLELARTGANLKGYISVHGGLTTPEGQNYSKAKGEFLIQHGAADTNVTMADFASLTEQLGAADVHFNMEVYGGAPHAWTVFGGDRYRKDADQLAWDSQLRFLNRVFNN